MICNFKYIFLIFFLFSCTQDFKKIKKYPKKNEKTYSSKGFALIYDDSFFKNKLVDKKLKNDQNFIFHSHLKNNRLVKISNPINTKLVTAKVINSNFPSIYNIVITKKMSQFLELDINNPYVEVYTTKKNEKFIAKKAFIYDEEKNVANKAPVTSIDINNLSTIEEKVPKNIKTTFMIDIANFYYQESAINLKNRFKDEANLLNITIKKMSQNKYNVYSGPYDSFNSMKDTYLSLNKLGFEELEIIKIEK